MYLKRILLAGVVSLLLNPPCYGENPKGTRYFLKSGDYACEVFRRENLSPKERDEQNREDIREAGKMVLEDLEENLKENWRGYKDLEEMLDELKDLREEVEFNIAIGKDAQGMSKDEDDNPSYLSNIYNKVKFKGIEPRLRFGIKSRFAEDFKSDIYAEINLADMDYSLKYVFDFMLLKGGIEYLPNSKEVVSYVNINKSF